MIAKVAGPLIVAAAVAGCAHSAPHAPSAPTPAAPGIDLVAMWEKATPCDGAAPNESPAVGGRGQLERDFGVTDADIVQDLRGIKVPADADLAAVAADIAQLRQGLAWLTWQLGESQLSYDGEADIHGDMEQAAREDSAEFQKARDAIETAIKQGTDVPPEVGTSFFRVCSHD